MKIRLILMVSIMSLNLIVTDWSFDMYSAMVFINRLVCLDCCIFMINVIADILLYFYDKLA